MLDQSIVTVVNIAIHSSLQEVEKYLSEKMIECYSYFCSIIDISAQLFLFLINYNF